MTESFPEQAERVLCILGEWTRRGWTYEPSMRLNHGQEFFVVDYTNPNYEREDLRSEGSSPFDALCQATTVMQVLLEEHPEEATWLVEGRASWSAYLEKKGAQSP